MLKFTELLINNGEHGSQLAGSLGFCKHRIEIVSNGFDKVYFSLLDAFPYDWFVLIQQLLQTSKHDVYGFTQVKATVSIFAWQIVLNASVELWRSLNDPILKELFVFCWHWVAWYVRNQFLNCRPLWRHEGQALIACFEVHGLGHRTEDACEERSFNHCVCE